MRAVFFLVSALAVSLIGGAHAATPAELQRIPLSRAGALALIPADAVKGTPANDVFPPVMNSPEWEDPVPLGEPVDTAGAEDSPFITPDGRQLYFFFTPDVRVPVEKQIIDRATGVYWSQKTDGGWSEPRRLILCDDLSLDGCIHIQGGVMWFASVRLDNYDPTRAEIYTAVYRGGAWTDWQNAGWQLNVDYRVGELCLTPDGETMYCGGPEAWDDFQGKDIYVLHRTEDGWSEPERLPPPIDTKTYNEDQPFVTPDGDELWFTGQSRMGCPGPAVFRCLRQADGSWGPPGEIISSFAGEPTLDARGNIYFIHHFFSREMNMIEADIYVAYRKTGAGG